jgi:hypothetical protein
MSPRTQLFYASEKSSGRVNPFGDRTANRLRWAGRIYQGA